MRCVLWCRAMDTVIDLLVQEEKKCTQRKDRKKKTKTLCRSWGVVQQALDGQSTPTKIDKALLDAEHLFLTEPCDPVPRAVALMAWRAHVPATVLPSMDFAACFRAVRQWHIMSPRRRSLKPPENELRQLRLWVASMDPNEEYPELKSVDPVLHDGQWPQDFLDMVEQGRALKRDQQTAVQNRRLDKDEACNTVWLDPEAWTPERLLMEVSPAWVVPVAYRELRRLFPTAVRVDVAFTQRKWHKRWRALRLRDSGAEQDSNRAQDVAWWTLLPMGSLAMYGYESRMPLSLVKSADPVAEMAVGVYRMQMIGPAMEQRMQAWKTMKSPLKWGWRLRLLEYALSMSEASVAWRRRKFIDEDVAFMGRWELDWPKVQKGTQPRIVWWGEHRWVLDPARKRIVVCKTMWECMAVWMFLSLSWVAWQRCTILPWARVKIVDP